MARSSTAFGYFGLSCNRRFKGAIALTLENCLGILSIQNGLGVYLNCGTISLELWGRSCEYENY